MGGERNPNVTAQREHVPRKTRGTRLGIGCLILSYKVFLNELSPGQYLVETLRVGLDFHVRQILKKVLDIISGRKVVCLCCFHNAVDHCAGPCPGRRVAEQPVLSADSKGADLVLCTVVGDLAARILQIVFHIRTVIKTGTIKDSANKLDPPDQLVGLIAFYLLILHLLAIQYGVKR